MKGGDRQLPSRLIALLVAVFLASMACNDEDVVATRPTPQHASPTATSPPASCSASGEDTDLEPQPDLPEPVAETRQEIAAAAAACDFDALQSLARAGSEPFTYSFGGGGRPARFWRRQERAGDEPLRLMGGVLARPFGTVEAGGSVQYVWPSAFAFQDWRDVPAEDREALKPLYDRQDFELFARFGGYIGYRIGISESGEWLYFVAGD